MELSKKRLRIFVATFCMQLGATALMHSQQPLLQIASPGNNSVATEGTTITITVSANSSVQGTTVLTQAPLPRRRANVVPKPVYVDNSG